MIFFLFVSWCNIEFWGGIYLKKTVLKVGTQLLRVLL